MNTTSKEAFEELLDAADRIANTWNDHNFRLGDAMTMLRPIVERCHAARSQPAQAANDVVKYCARCLAGNDSGFMHTCVTPAPDVVERVRAAIFQAHLNDKTESVWESMAKDAIAALQPATQSPIGSNFESFLDEKGIKDEVYTVAQQRLDNQLPEVLELIDALETVQTELGFSLSMDGDPYQKKAFKAATDALKNYKSKEKA